MEQPYPYILDRRPRFPEPLGVNVPRGTRERLKRAADRAGLSVAEFARRALESAMAEPTKGAHHA